MYRTPEGQQCTFSWRRGHIYDHAIATVLYENCVDSPTARIAKVGIQVACSDTCSLPPGQNHMRGTLAPQQCLLPSPCACQADGCPLSQVPSTEGTVPVQTHVILLQGCSGASSLRCWLGAAQLCKPLMLDGPPAYRLGYSAGIDESASLFEFPSHGTLAHSA